MERRRVEVEAVRGDERLPVQLEAADLQDSGRAALEVGLRKVRAEQAARRGEGPGPDEQLLADYAAADEALFAPIRRQVGLDQVRRSVTGAVPSALDALYTGEGNAGAAPLVP